MARKFLLIDNEAEANVWSKKLCKALSSMGEVKFARELEALETIDRDHYDIVIVDTSNVKNSISLVARIWSEHPQQRIIVTAQSPDWREAVDMMQAGASEYMRRLQSEKEIQARVQTVLDTPPPSQERWKTH